MTSFADARADPIGLVVGCSVSPAASSRRCSHCATNEVAQPASLKPNRKHADRGGFHLLDLGRQQGGYHAREHEVVTKDSVVLRVVRATNPLVARAGRIRATRAQELQTRGNR
jgi:hypothetical protein